MLGDNTCTGRPAAGTSTGEITDRGDGRRFWHVTLVLDLPLCRCDNRSWWERRHPTVPRSNATENLNSMFKTRNVAESSRNPLYSSLYRTFGCLNERTLKRDQLQEALFSESYPGSEPPISRDVSLSLKMHIPLCHDHPCSRSTSKTVQMR